MGERGGRDFRGKDVPDFGMRGECEVGASGVCDLGTTDEIRQGIVKFGSWGALCRSLAPAPLEELPDQIINLPRRPLKNLPCLYLWQYVAVVMIVVRLPLCQDLGYRRQIQPFDQMVQLNGGLLRR